MRTIEKIKKEIENETESWKLTVKADIDEMVGYIEKAHELLIDCYDTIEDLENKNYELEEQLFNLEN